MHLPEKSCGASALRLLRSIACSTAWIGALSLVLLATSVVQAAPASAAAASATPQLVLDKTVLLLRHGLRSPNQTPEELLKSASRPWPEWPVGAGELTEHGSLLLRQLGHYYRLRYAAQGLLEPAGCPQPGTVLSWTDNAAARIPLSGVALLEGLYPGCRLRPGFVPQTAVDPIFNPVGAGVCTISAGKARAAVLRAAGGDLDRAISTVQPAMNELQSLLKVRSLAGCAGMAPSCGLDGQLSLLQDGKEGPTIEGALKRAATVAENIGFAYMEGKPASEVGWGEAATPEALAALYPPRNLYLDLLRKPPYLAARHTSALAQAILAALDESAAAGAPNASRLLAFVGRDQHLAGMSGLLGINWVLPDQPDVNAVGATLAFERLRDAAGRPYVRLKLVYQTLQQMRQATELDLAHPPAELLLHLPGCAKQEVDGACPLPVLRQQLQRVMARDCVVSSQ